MPTAPKTRPLPPPAERPRYDADVYGWAMDQGALIRAGRLAEVDWANVAEEIESVGRAEFRELASALRGILLHMLKWEAQPEKRTRSWSLSIAEHRRRAERTIADNPSLRPRLEEALAHAHELARLRAARETELPLTAFAETCPFTLAEALRRAFDPPGALLGA